MDNMTHALLGACGGVIVSDITGGSLWGLTICGAVASQMPDLDIITSKGSDVYYMKRHRGVSHGVLMIPIEAILFSLMVWFLSNLPFGQVFGASMVALILHIFTDGFNSYGTKLLWPFSQKRYAWDLLEVCDVYLMIILALGVVLSLVYQTLFSYIALLLMVGYIGLRFILHQWALRIAYRQLPEEIWRIAILPRVRVMKWNFIAVSDECYYLGQVCLYAKKLYISNRYDRPLLEEWDDSTRMRAFAAFSRFPYCYYDADEKAWMDMRYGLYKKNKGPLNFKFKDKGTKK